MVVCSKWMALLSFHNKIKLWNYLKYVAHTCYIFILQLIVHGFHKRKTKILKGWWFHYYKKTAIFTATHEEILINGYTLELYFLDNIHFPQVSSFGEFLCPTCQQVPSQDTQWPMTPPIMFGEFTTCSCESSMLQFIQHILPRNLHLAFTLHDSILERAQKKLYGYLGGGGGWVHNNMRGFWEKEGG